MREKGAACDKEAASLRQGGSLAATDRRSHHTAQSLSIALVALSGGLDLFLLLIRDMPPPHDAGDTLGNLRVAMPPQVVEQHSPGVAGKLPRTLALADGAMVAVALEHVEEKVAWSLVELDADALLEALGDVWEDLHS